MRLLKWTVVLSAWLMLGLVVAQAASAQTVPLQGEVVLRPINGSGIRGNLDIVNTRQNRLVVTGSATGLDPAGTYVTLIYGAGSEVDGPTPCVGPIRFSGNWIVDQDGNGTLFALVDAWPVNVKSASIRSVQIVGVAPIGERGSVGTADLTLEACGKPRVTFVGPR